MSELKTSGVESDTRNSPLQGFFRVILAVADDGVADGGKLYPNLILQSCDQRDTNKRSGAETAFDGIPQFRPSRFRAARGGQLLKHSLPAKIVDERFFFATGVDAEMSTNHREILPHWGMAKELSNKRVAIALGLCK